MIGPAPSSAQRGARQQEQRFFGDKEPFDFLFERLSQRDHLGTG
jgi:hypothetical protein